MMRCPNTATNVRRSSSSSLLLVELLLCLVVLVTVVSGQQQQQQRLEDDCRTTPINGPIDENTGYLDMTNIFQFCSFGSKEQECCNVATFENDDVSLLACSRWNASVSHTICKGSCRGRNACVGWGGGAGSSSGGSATADTNTNGTASGGGVHVSKNSCVGTSACAELFVPTMIGENSCLGGSSCRAIGKEQQESNPTAIVEIHTSACVKDFSCAHMGAPTIVGNYSCDGNSACSSLGHNISTSDASSTIIDIGVSACIGLKSCEEIAYHGKQVTIKDNACNGFSACRQIMTSERRTSSGGGEGDGGDGAGVDGGVTVSLGVNSCSGYDNICRNIGSSNTNTTVSTIEVQDNSCIDYLCTDVGTGGTNDGEYQPCVGNDGGNCPPSCRSVDPETIEFYGGCWFSCVGQKCKNLGIPEDRASTPFGGKGGGGGSGGSGGTSSSSLSPTWSFYLVAFSVSLFLVSGV